MDSATIQVPIGSTMLPENTLSFLVRETVSTLQAQGLLLTAEQIAEYNQLKREKEDVYLTGIEAAEILGVTNAAVTIFRQSGKINGYRLGRRWKYSKLEILDFKKKIA